MRRTFTSKALALAVACGTAPAIAGTAPAALADAPGASPSAGDAATELAPLAQKMETLTIGSSHISGAITLSGHLPRVLRALDEQTATYTAEENTSPAMATVSETLLGHVVTIRLVGGKAYVENPALAARDGGRPWVQVSPRDTGASPSVVAATAFGSTLGVYKTSAALLEDATDVRSLGTSTIAGQSVSGFAGTLAPMKIEEPNLPTGLRVRIRKLGLKLTGAIETFVAADGLPVHTVLTLGIGGVHMKISDEISAVDQPIVPVSAPAPSETISVSEERALNRRAAGRQAR
ncbi:MAG TPA: hypothetical protein VL979_14355 [Solirubrobacteraceae bacterium]|nr:hypothetical protein [Solirubrobacteraceae bacterium]